MNDKDKEKSNENIIIQQIKKINGKIKYKKYHKIKLIGKGRLSLCYEVKNI